MNTKHVPILETCQTLRKLGYPQDTEFYWVLMNYDDEWKLRKLPEIKGFKNTNEDYFSAPLVSELGEMLPDQIIKDVNVYDLVTQKLEGGKWGIKYCDDPPDREERETIAREWGFTEAEARALMWIYLKKEGLI